MRLAAVLGLEGHAGGSDAGLQGPLGAKGAKKGRTCCHRQSPSQLGCFHTELAYLPTEGSVFSSGAYLSDYLIIFNCRRGHIYGG